MPIWRVARNELLSMRRDGMLRAASVFALGLVASLGLAGWQRFEQERGSRTAFVAEAREQFESQGARHPHRAASFGQYVAKPDLRLALFDAGIGPSAGAFLWLEAHRRAGFTYAPSDDSSAAARAGVECAADAVQIFGALLVVLAGHGAIAREREGGTLHLLLAQGVSPARWLAGKALGLAIGLTAVAAPAAALLLLAGWAADPVPAGGQVAARTGALVLGYGAYGAVWLGLTLAVSCRARTARGALVALIGIWLLSTVVAPRLAATAASSLAPVPSLSEFEAAHEHDFAHGFDGLPGWDERLASLERRTLESHGVETLAELPVGFSGIRMHAMDEWGNQVSDRQRRRLEAVYTRQTRWHLAAAALGPMLPVRALSRGLSGTDWAHYQHFSDAAESYRRSVVLALDRMLEQSLTGDRWEISFGREVWAAVPRFSYAIPGFRWAAARVAAPAALLAAWVVLALAAAALGVRAIHRP